MSRTLPSPALLLLSCGVLLGLAAGAAAQQRPGAAPQDREGRVRLQPGAPDAGSEVSPELEAVLRDWARASARIEKLQGKHYRYEYDFVYEVQRIAAGVFYYERPDKGRIDLVPRQLRPGKAQVRKDPRTGATTYWRQTSDGEVQVRVNPETGRLYAVEESAGERWIADGKQVCQVDDAEKKVEVFPLDPQQQGENIMDGPLPFLFGMPPEKAKQRYVLELVNNSEQIAWLKVEPRWQQDAANWSQAQVMLDKERWLPRAVKIYDPSGNLETVYTFKDIEVNSEQPWWRALPWSRDENPFQPRLAGYKVNVVQPRDPAGADEAPRLPSLVGLSWPEARRLLERLDCQIELRAGEAAPREELVYRVASQQPAADAPYQKGMKVSVTVFNSSQAAPPLAGLHWKDAQTLLEAAGLEPKFTPGRPAPREDLTYSVYAQEPERGAPVTEGQEVRLTLFNKPPKQTSDSRR